MCIAQAGLKLVTVLLQLPESWDERCGILWYLLAAELLGMEAASAAVLINWLLDVSRRLKFYLVLMANSFLWSLAFEGSQVLGCEA